MLLDSPGYPHIPTFDLEPTYSFYPYPISSRSHVHHILLKPSPHAAAKRQSSLPTPANNGLSGVSFVPQPVMAISGPGPSTQMIRSQSKSKARAQRRALMGKRPAGIDLSRHADELSEEEDAMADEKQEVNMFGHRFLLPYGRRLTQMEMDAAPSPTPSEADQDRRQEDRNMASPSEALDPPLGDDGLDDVDLDASVDDLDADVDDLDDTDDDMGGDDDEEDSDEEGSDVYDP